MNNHQSKTSFITTKQDLNRITNEEKQTIGTYCRRNEAEILGGERCLHHNDVVSANIFANLCDSIPEHF